MTRTSRKRLVPILLGGLVLGLSMNAPAKAEELRIGFIAPLTGIFAQVGKDMTNGFQMYLDEHHNKFGGADVKFVVEDNQGKGDAAVTKAKKLVLSDKVQHVHRRLAGLDRLCAGSGEHRREDASTSRRSRRPTTSPSGRPASTPTSSAPPGPRRSRIIRSANGPANRATRRSSPSPPIMPSATKWSAASRRRSRTAAARSSRRSGRGWAKRTSAPTFRRSNPTPTPCSR